MGNQFAAPEAPPAPPEIPPLGLPDVAMWLPVGRTFQSSLGLNGVSLRQRWIRLDQGAGWYIGEGRIILWLKDPALYFAILFALATGYFAWRRFHRLGQPGAPDGPVAGAGAAAGAMVLWAGGGGWFGAFAGLRQLVPDESLSIMRFHQWQMVRVSPDGYGSVQVSPPDARSLEVLLSA